MGNDAPIGVFDSGIGGLTVMREIMRQIPNEAILYFGDTARVPYGNKSSGTIIEYSREISRFLLKKKVKALVIACNSASAVASDVVKEELDIPVIEVIRPGARAAAKATKNGKIGVIGTETTINSQLYPEYLKEIQPGVKVFSKACPLFVPLVEENWLYDSVTVEVAGRYMSEIIGYGIDTCVLGCTHYPLLFHTIQKVLGEEVTLVNPAYETALELERVLVEQRILNDGQVAEHEAAEHKIYVSDGAKKFKAFANTILPCEVEEVKNVNLAI